ncbi:response regulator [bacterium]|nr:response regulator [bacterium]
MIKDKKAKILIVDDEPVNINILGNLLQKDYDIMVAIDGKNCLNLARVSPHPDLILLDIMMPKMDGYEVCRQLQAENQTKNIPVIFVSAAKTLENEARGLSIGAVDYIIKPFNNDIVKARVAIHLKLKQQRDALFQKQQELNLANQKNRMILNTVAEGIYGVDQTGSIGFINPAALKMIGRKEDEVLGKRSCEIMHPNWITDKKPQCIVLQAMLQREIKENIDAVFLRKDKTSFPVEFIAAPVIEKSSPVGAVVIFKDISKRKRIERELHKADKLKSFEVLTGGIAHDFNNILSTTMGNLQIAMMDIKPDNGIYALLDKTYNSTLIMQDLAAKFLTISQGIMLTEKEFQLKEIINQVIKSIHSDDNIDFQITVPDNTWSLKASQLHIIQLLNNILLNSKEAMINGGTITITVQNCPDGSTEYPHLKHAPYLKISVQDQGEGISSENYPKIFDPYFSTKPKGVQKGMGLGLTICQAIIKGHQGYLKVESIPGSGTTVHIYLLAIVNDKSTTG